MAKPKLMGEFDTNAYFNGTKKQAKEVAKNSSETIVNVSEAKETREKFVKPASDYFRLDLVLRDTETIKTKYVRKNRITKETDTICRNIDVYKEDVVKDYKEYLTERAKEENTSITKYLHKLIDADMKAHPKSVKKHK